MSEFRIKLNLDGLPAVRAAIFAEINPLLTEAVGAIAGMVSTTWFAAIQRARGLSPAERDAYSGSITPAPGKPAHMTGAFSALVWSDYKYADEIENGRPARDLKKMLDTSLKVRRGKSGRRYLIIPFRHNTPGNDATAASMPQHVYDVARKLKPSVVTGMTTRLSGTGAFDIKTRQMLTVPQRVYKWGGRLPPGMAGPVAKGHTDRFAGMVKMKEAGSRAKYSQFMTFRVMAEGSPGWIIPPRPGLGLVKGVVADLQPVAEEIFREAVKRGS